MASDIYATLNPGTRGRQRPGVLQEDVHHRRRQLLKEFSYRMKQLLTASVQDYLLAALKEYQMYNQLEKLILCLRAVLDTPAKLDLLKDIRYFLSANQIMTYDRLVPYHKMAHPWQLKSVSTMPRSRSQRVNIMTTPQRIARTKAQVVNGSTEVLASECAPLKVISLIRGEGEPLGFSIRGGSEHGLGIFISDVEHGTAAEHAGLRAGDNIIEVNSISFDNIASSSAVKVLGGSHRLKILLRRVHKIPGFKTAREKISWYDVVDNCIVEGDLAEHGSFHDPSDLTFKDNPLRSIKLKGNKKGQHFLGFNIRGGSEYGLGIFISKVDFGGLAEECGLKVGDQIVEVNGHNFMRVTHAQAVEAMQFQKHLNLTVKDVCRYPAFKEIFAEYQWLDTITGNVTRTRTYQKHIFGNNDSVIRSVPVEVDDDDEDYTEYPPESRIESYAHTDDAHTDDDSADELDVESHITKPVDVGMRTEYTRSFLPKQSDIQLKERRPAHVNKHIVKQRKREEERPTLAVRAMEMEARRKYPDMAFEWDSLTPEQREARIYSRDEFDLDLGDNGSWPRSFKDMMSAGSRGRNGHAEPPQQIEDIGVNSTSVEKPLKGKSRKPLSNLNFMIPSNRHSGDATCFERGIGSQIGLMDCLSSNGNMADIEESSRRVLTNDDEIKALLRHLKNYEKGRNLEQLLGPLFAILDTREKLYLLREIRSVIHPNDLANFDHRVVTQEQVCLRELMFKSSPSHQVSLQQRPWQPDQNNGVTQNDSGSRKPMFNSTREEDYKNRIEAQRHLLEQERRTFTQEQLRHHEYGGPLSPVDGEKEVEEIVIPKAPDAKYDYEIHRYLSNSRVYKGDHHSAEVIQAHSVQAHSVQAHSVQAHSVQAHSVQGVNGARFSGAFLEDDDNHHYHVIPEVSTTSSVLSTEQTPSVHDSGLGSSLSSHPGGANVQSPVYATVQKKDRLCGKQAVNDLPENNYDLSSVYESLDLPESDTQLIYRDRGQIPKSYSRSEDYWDSQSETYQEAKRALNFLDDLKTSDDDDDEYDNDGPVILPRSTSLSSQPGTPMSEVSSSNESRFGAYDVNPSPSANERLPPRFIPPPPPDESPPSESPRLVNDDNDDDDDNNISGVKYTKRQTSYDGHYGDSLRASLGRMSGTRVKDVVDVKIGSHHSGITREISASNNAVNFEQKPRLAVKNNIKSPFQISPLKLKQTLITNDEGLTNFGCEERDESSVIRTITLRKTHASLGFSISGGIDSRSQPEIKVDKIFPGGAASAQGQLKADMIITSIDSHTLVAVTHKQAVDIIRKTFSHKHSPTMTLTVQDTTKS